MTRSVVILGYPGVQALDMVGPFDVFTGATMNLAARNRADDGYDVTIASVDGAQIATGTGLVLVAQPLPDPHGSIDTVVLPGGWGLDEARKNPGVVDWVKAVSGTARRVVSVCTGAFLAAQAGLLDGCRATTHWAFADELAREFPSIAVDPDPIFVQSSSTLRCRWSRRTTAPRWRRRWPGIWCSICVGPAGRASSPHPCGCPAPSARRSARCRSRSRRNPVPRTASPIWPAGPR